MAVVCVLSLTSLDALAQTPTTTIPSVMLKLQVTISRYMGTTRVSSQPYSLTLVPNESGSIRVGTEVPVPTTTSTTTTTAAGERLTTPTASYTLQQVGTQIDGNAVIQPDGRYKIRLTVTDRSVITTAQGTEQGARVANVPAFRNVVFNSTIYLGDGQSTQFSDAPDKVSGENFRVDVSLAVQK
jgi:type II secretory pathway component GspD/PulD (secretin)